jgi:hypothetical protein
MKLSLQDSLSVTRSKVKAIYISVLNKSQRVRAQLIPYLCIGLLCVVFGISVYYLLPKALISFDYGLLLQVFFTILLALFLGLTLMAINL